MIGMVFSGARVAGGAWRGVVLGVWLLLGVLLAGHLHAAAPAYAPLQNYQHTGWGPTQGAPAEVRALAQGPDGYLWIAAASGLLRFDGVRFTPYRPDSGDALPADTAVSLTVLPQGEVWVGYMFGGAARIVDGHATVFAPGQQGFPQGSVWRVARASGSTWVATMHGLARLQGSQWVLQGAAQGIGQDTVYTILSDRRGVLWVQMGDGVYYLPPGATRFQRYRLTLPKVDVEYQTQLAQSPEGAVWLAGFRLGLRELVDAQGQVPPHPHGYYVGAPIDMLLFDRHGWLWFTDDVGLKRVRLADLPAADAPAALHAAVAVSGYAPEKLSGWGPTGMALDGEGNLWLGTSVGVDQLRPNVVRLLAGGGLGGGGAALARDGDTMWIALYSGGPRRVAGSGEATRLLPGDGQAASVTMLYRDAPGVLLAGGRGGLWWLDAAGTRPLQPPWWTGQPAVQAAVRDTQGRLWVSVQRMGVFVEQAGHWQKNAGLPGLPQEPAIRMVADGRGGLLLGYTGNRLFRVQGERVESYGLAQGLAVGNVIGILPIGQGVLVSGERGVALLRAGRFQPLLLRDGSAPAGVSGMVLTAQGELWLNGRDGLLRIGADELRRWLATPSYGVSAETFNYLDGLVGSPNTVRPLPSMVDDAGGRLWLATGQGVYWLDPAHIPRNPVVPPVRIESVEVDGRSYRPQRELSLPQGTRALQIRYTALSLSVPQRVRFRYRLSRVDADWQQVDTRREAFYTNLEPGQYRFQVLASNNDGVWNTQGATLDFSIRPAFYQRGWFYLVCGALLALALWLLYRLRLRQLARRLQQRLEGRHQERERLARELHDTLLQGFQGLVLHLQAIASRPQPAEPQRSTLRRLVGQASLTLTEARERMVELRAQSVPHNDLPAALQQAAESYAQVHPASYRLTVQGDVRPLDAEAQDELYLLAREALGNAFAHAQAQHIELLLDYRADGLLLRVCDDGRGIDEGVLAQGHRPGRWGLVGMRERAKTLDAQLVLRRRQPAGTELELQVPAGVIYTRRRRRRWRPRPR